MIHSADLVWWETATLGLYLAVLGLLAIYGLHRWHLVALHRRHRGQPPQPPGRFAEPPLVTVQLPVYNERYVVDRLIAAVCSLDWPRDRLEIQVLDDSTDDTVAVAAEAVARWRAEGFDIHHVRRADRHGYKAGALDHGLGLARGEFLLIFDADFVPRPELLREMADHFTDPAVGLVQARWDHINREHSLLTQVQALMLDGHFVVEHAARHRSGRFFNFNGTAGLWRRGAIEMAGGWQHDTLTEDLDLSYRAQLAGWRFVYLADLTAPAELPVEMDAFKGQQHRWTKGSVQTGLKLLPRLWRAPLPLRVKAEATFHLTDNFSYLLMIALALLLGPVILIRAAHHLNWLYLVDLPLFFAGTLSVSAFYLWTLRETGGLTARRVLLLPALMALGIGLCLNNGRAVLEALRGKPSPFVRTPKHRIERRGQRWTHLRYRAARSWLPVLEVTFGVAWTGITALAIWHGQYLALPILWLFPVGFLFVGAVSLGQRLGRSRTQA